MEMWRPRLRCTLQHSSHTSTPLLMEAQPGSAREWGEARVSHSQLQARPPAHLLRASTMLSVRTCSLPWALRAWKLGHQEALATDEEAELRQREGFPHELTAGDGHSRALSYTYLALWEGVVPRAYSAGMASRPAVATIIPTAFPREQDCYPSLPQGSGDP